MESMGITKFNLLLKTKKIPPLSALGEHMHIKCLPFDDAMLLPLSKGLCQEYSPTQAMIVSKSILDGYIMYRDTFQDALDNLEKVLVRCQVTKLSLGHEKCKFLLTKGIILGHHISPTRIGLDLAKTKFIQTF